MLVQSGGLLCRGEGGKVVRGGGEGLGVGGGGGHSEWVGRGRDREG